MKNEKQSIEEQIEENRTAFETFKEELTEYNGDTEFGDIIQKIEDDNEKFYVLAMGKDLLSKYRFKTYKDAEQYMKYNILQISVIAALNIFNKIND